MGLIQQILTPKKNVQFIKNDNTVLTIDCTIKQNHSRKSTPTKFQIEDGKTISDHIILDPFKLTLEGIISDSPLSIKAALISSGASIIGNKLGGTAGAFAAVGGVALYNALKNSKKPSAEALIQILNLQELKEPFNVLTSLQLYRDMWITDLQIPIDDKTGDVLHFNITLEQLIIVKPQSANIQKFSKGDLAQEQKDKGKQEAESQAGKFFDKGVAAVHKKADQVSGQASKLVGGG